MDDSLCPLSLGSSVAIEVLEKLFKVEKALKNETFEFNQEAKTTLEEIAEAVKKLECMRKTTIDLLEIESIEASRLRFLLIHLPGNISKEIEDAVIAARVTNAEEINSLNNAIETVNFEMELLNERLTNLEKMNIELWEEQEELADDHQKAVLMVNMKMKERAENDTSTKEIYDKKKVDEEKIDHYQDLLHTINTELTEERDIFVTKKESLEKKIAELKQLKDDEIKCTLKKKRQLSQMVTEIAKIKEEFKRRQGAMKEQDVARDELEEGLKRLQKELQIQLKQPEQLVTKRTDYDNALVDLVESSKMKQKDLIDKIRQATEKFSKIKARHTDLKGKNKILNGHLKAAQLEEHEYYIKERNSRDLVDKIELLIAEKKALLSKKLMDTEALEEAIENLKHLYRTTIESYRKQIAFLKGNWMSESQKSIKNQWKVINFQKEHERWRKTEHDDVEELIKRVEYIEQKRAEIYEEGIFCDETIFKHEEKIEELSEAVKEEEEIFSQIEHGVTEELKVIEDEYIIETEQTKVREDEWDEYFPKLKAVKDEYEENIKEFESLKSEISAQTREHLSLERGIDLMRKETITYQKEREHIKNLLKKGRNKEFAFMRNHLDSMYTSEKNIYEVEQHLKLLVLENYRLKKAIRLVKEDINYLTKEGQGYKFTVKKLETEVQNLRDVFLNMWKETLKEVKKFKEKNMITLDETEKLIRYLYLREERLKVICGWLRRNADNLEYIIDYKESTTIIDIVKTDEGKKKKKSSQTGKKQDINCH
ncbi:coiled-coil domain-containing protein 175 isoform X1 [Sarcophilus harrisii]|uniref:coiled-coil domain-containing protein 175 isoform X1 n=1 Tax=Sarcophilus harrisii TaxID=9305 RepID=UPI001301A657|nr:coiled-coil domain-containing protein 175 isoform X1 [Sarcophilus harrisii]